MFSLAGGLFLFLLPVFGSIDDKPSVEQPRTFNFPFLNLFGGWKLPLQLPKLTLYVDTRPSVYTVPYNPVPNIFQRIINWKRYLLGNLFHKPYIVNKPFLTTTTTTSAPDILPCECGLRNPARKIVGGTETDVNEYPWMAAICEDSPCNTDTQLCGGSLINNMYILTAAHCFDTFTGETEDITISLGDHNINSDSEAFPVVLQAEEIILHPDYDPNAIIALNDIALIKLESKPPLSDRIRPICLPENDAETYAGDDSIATGWGATVFGGGGVEALREVTLPVLSNDDCETELNFAIDPLLLCAGEAGVDSCQGDSGGPLSTEIDDNKYVQIGVVSFGQNCGVEPGLYTRVTKFLDWIEENTQDALYCAS